jgi:hypothetical protein
MQKNMDLFYRLDLNMYRLKTETEPSLRNVVLNKERMKDTYRNTLIVLIKTVEILRIKILETLQEEGVKMWTGRIHFRVGFTCGLW